MTTILTKSIDLTNSIIRIIDANGETIGTGFVLADNLAVTCAHVVENAHSGPGELLNIRFYSSDVLQTVRVHTQGYRPYESDNDDVSLDDVAFLELEDLPSNVQPVTLGSAEGRSNCLYHTFGFARLDEYEERHVTEHTISGIVNHSTKQPMLQLNGDLIKQGVSGSPVLDVEARQVVGMISEFADDIGDGAHPTAVLNWATTADTLKKLWPDLTIQPDPQTTLLADYRRQIFEDTEFISLQGIPISDGLDSFFPLERIYIKVQAIAKRTQDKKRRTETDTMVEQAQAEAILKKDRIVDDFVYIVRMMGEELYRRGETAEFNTRPDPIDPEQALNEHSHLVILGAPGAGKSTLINYLAHKAAIAPNGPLPIIIRVREYIADKRSLSLREFAIKQASNDDKNLEQAIETYIANGRVLWLVDGLDEAGDEASDIATKANHLPGGKEEHQLVITSRPIGYPYNLNRKIFEILPLEAKDTNQFLTDWFSVLAEKREHPQNWVATQVKELQNKIFDRPRLVPILHNPLLLTFLVILFEQNPNLALPQSRSELYEQYVRELLLKHWEKSREKDLSVDLLWESYLRLGWDLHRLYYSSRLEAKPNEETLSQLLADHLQIEISTANKLIDFWENAGLLDKLTIKAQKIFTFRHLTFQEYAVAKYLYQMWQFDPDDTWQQIRTHLYHDVWHETFLLLAGLMEEEHLQDFLERVLQSSKPYNHPKSFFTKHKFIGALILIPFALVLFPVFFIMLALFLPVIIVVRLSRGDIGKPLPQYTNRYIRWLLRLSDELIEDFWQKRLSDNDNIPQTILTILKQWAEQWKKQFSANKAQALLALLKDISLLIFVLIVIPVFFAIISLKYAMRLLKYYGEKIQIYFLSKRLQRSNAQYLKKSMVAALQHEILLAAKLIGEVSLKINTANAEVVAQSLAGLMRSDIPSLARMAAEAAASVSEGKAGKIMLNVLIQDIYLGRYRGGNDDEYRFSSMPISGRVLRQQARQKRMSLDTVYALLSEINRIEQYEQTIAEKNQIIQYVYLVRYLLSNTRRVLNNGEGRDWIVEILSYYDEQVPELVELFSSIVEHNANKHDPPEVALRLAQKLVLWDQAPPAALTILIYKISGGTSSGIRRGTQKKELFDAIEYGFSTGQISGETAQKMIWYTIRSFQSYKKDDDVERIFLAALSPSQPHPDVSRMVVFICIGAENSKEQLGYIEYVPSSVLTSVLSKILISDRAEPIIFEALEEGLVHHDTDVRQTVMKILDETLQAEPNLNTDQILRLLLKTLDNDEMQIRFWAASTIKNAAKANIIGGELIKNLDPSEYSFEDAISKLQSDYRYHLDYASNSASPTRTPSEGKEEIPEEVKKVSAQVEAIALYQKLWRIDKTDSNGKELWQKTLARLESVAKSGHIQEQWLEPFIQLYEDLENETAQNEELISGLPGYESARKLATELILNLENKKYGDEWHKYFKIAHNVEDTRKAMSTVVLILANAALNNVLNTASVQFLLRELKYNTTFNLNVYANIAKHRFATPDMVETLLGFLDYRPSYAKQHWERDRNPEIIYVLGQVYSGNPAFREQVLRVINQVILHDDYRGEVDVVIKLLAEHLIPASELAPAILESLDMSAEISSSQTKLLGHLSTQYPVSTQYVRKVIYITRKFAPLGWVGYLDGLGLIIQQESCEREAFHLIVSSLLYGVYDLGPDYDEFRQPVADILVAANIIQPEDIDNLFTVLSKKRPGPDHEWLDAARSIGNILNAQEEQINQEDQKRCLLSVLYYLFDDSDGEAYWPNERIIQLLGFVDFQANTNFLLDILRKQTSDEQYNDIRIEAVYALTEIGYRHQDRQEDIVNAFYQVFFEGNSSLRANDNRQFLDYDTSINMAIVRAVGNLQNYSLASAKGILLKALEYRSNKRSSGSDLSTVAAEAFTSIKLEPGMLEEITKLLINLSSPNDETRDAAWKVLNTLDVEAITSLGA